MKMKKLLAICALALSASLMCASMLWAAAATLDELDVLLGDGVRDDYERREEAKKYLEDQGLVWATTLLDIDNNTKLFGTMDEIFPQGASFPADLRLGRDVSPTEVSMLLQTGFPQLSALGDAFDTDAERKAYEKWQRMFSSLEPTLYWLFNDEFYKPLMERYGLFAWLAKSEGGFAYDAIVTARDDLPSERPTAELRRALDQFTSSGASDATEIFNAWARDIFSDRVFKSVTVSEEGSALRVRASLASGFVAKIGSGQRYFRKAIDGAQSFRDMVGRLQSIRDALKSAVGGVADLAGSGSPLPDIAENVRALQKFSTAYDRFFTEHVMNGYHSLDASAYNKMLADVLEDPSLFRDPLTKMRDALREVIGGGMQSHNGRAVLIAVE